MRIIGGRSRGLKLADVGEGDARSHLRPTSDRVREAIFNLLINGGYDNPVAGARVLDLFAGTGALGLEALSRGAESVSFVESGAPALAILRRNIALMRAGTACRIEKRDAVKPAPPPPSPVTLCFLDPPYGKGLGEAALAAHAGWLSPGALVVWEENTPPVPPEGFTLLDQRRYGDTLVAILEAP